MKNSAIKNNIFNLLNPLILKLLHCFPRLVHVNYVHIFVYFYK